MPLPSDPPSLAAVRGQATALRAFEAALDGESGRARVAGAYLLHGPEGVGRALGASGFASALLCARPSGASPCGRCRACRWIVAGTHPDLLAVAAETGPWFKDDGEAQRSGPGQFTQAHHRGVTVKGRRAIPVRTIRRLLALLSLSAVGGGRKVVVVDSLDEIEEEGVATLLKSLEEPPPDTTFLVLARGLDGVPDTILSRCQRIRFQPLAPSVVRSLLRESLELDRVPPPEVEERIVRLAQGSIGRALRAVDSGVADRAGTVVDALLSGGSPGSVSEAVAWVREAGRELVLHRERVRELVALSLLTLRDRAAASGSSDELDTHLPALVGALESVDANVAPDLVLHALWARIGRARRA